MASPKFTPQMTVPQFEALLPTEDACKSYLVARRWPKGPRCPRCELLGHPIALGPPPKADLWGATQGISMG